MEDTQLPDEEHIPSNATFSSLGLDTWLVNALAAMSIKRTTPIQAACINPVLDGRSPLTSANG
jgi:superfamily II DNA/RNA helicase